MQSEKLASMGQLAAGIAHEVNNPLGTVLMLSHILLDETERTTPQREDLSDDRGEADRCKKIVSGLLHFARKNKVEGAARRLRELVDQIAARCTWASPSASRVVAARRHVTAEIDRDQICRC
jgi:two-component system NtrC family sensor kinase